MWIGFNLLVLVLWALLITCGIIAASMLFSMLKTRAEPTDKQLREAARWWVPGSPPKAEPASREKKGAGEP